MRFEYLTTFVPMDYESADRGVWIFKVELPPREPIVESLTDNPILLSTDLSCLKDGL